MNDFFVVDGGYPLKGEIEVGGAKNVILPALVAGLLTDEKVVLENAPLIADLFSMIHICETLGVKTKFNNHELTIDNNGFLNAEISLEAAAKLRTSFMMVIPLILRFGKAKIPNPGGCRIGARPVERLIEGLQSLGVKVKYAPSDGYFWMEAQKLTGATYRFSKNSHMGTEMMLMAAALANGKTILENAALEPEVDDLIKLLNQMGAKIKRVRPRTIVIDGVKKLNGASYKIMSDRNEAVTLAIAAVATHGDVLVKWADQKVLSLFLEKLEKAGAGWEPLEKGIRFYYKKTLQPADITTACYPGFMTDWQAPWAVLMTQAQGVSRIHETIYESRFQYVLELIKMGAKISFYNPKVSNSNEVYNFNLKDEIKNYFHAVKIVGPTGLHNAVLEIPDLRAGATLVLAALTAPGKSYISGVEHLDRGYEKFEERLTKLGAKIKRAKE